jgi:hypothetical protein
MCLSRPSDFISAFMWPHNLLCVPLAGQASCCACIEAVAAATLSRCCTQTGTVMLGPSKLKTSVRMLHHTPQLAA